MSFTAVAGAAVGVIGGAIVGNQNKKSSSGADPAAAELAQISREEWDLYKAEAIPMLRELAGMRKPTTVEEEQALAAGEVKTAFGSARQSAERALSQVRNPGDQGTAAIMSRSYLDEAGAVSKALTDARRMVSDRDWGRSLQAISAYQKLPTEAGANLGMSGRLSEAATARKNQSATQAAYGIGTIAGEVIRGSSWSNRGGGGDSAGGYPAQALDAGDYGAWNDDLYGAGYTGAADYGAQMGDTYLAHGGRVKGPGTGTSDSIPAKLSHGEYVIPADVVKQKGQEFFDKLLQKYHRPVAESGGESENGMANGGALRKRGLPADIEDAIFRSIPRRAISRSGRR